MKKSRLRTHIYSRDLVKISVAARLAARNNNLQRTYLSHYIYTQSSCDASVIIFCKVNNIRNEIFSLLQLKLGDWISGITRGKFTNEFQTS